MTADIFSTRRERQAVIDELIASMLAGLRAGGMDLTGPVAASTRLGFQTAEEARRAGGDLILAGWPGVRVWAGRTAEQPPGIEVLFEMVLTVASIRDVRRQVAGFAEGRRGTVLDDHFGGESPFGRALWTGPNQKQWESELEQEDLAVVDQLTASGVDVKEPCTITAGVGFASERLARAVGADLFVAGWPEVHVVQGGPKWVVETVTHVVPVLDALRKMRRDLTRLAAVRSGQWFGFSTAAPAGKELPE